MANNSSTPSFLEAGWHISYMNYFATGEGVTACIAVAGEAEYAKRVLKEKLPEFFHQFMVTEPIDFTASDEAKMMIKWIPEEAKKMLARLPRGAGYYFTEFHYNLS